MEMYSGITPEYTMGRIFRAKMVDIYDVWYFSIFSAPIVRDYTYKKIGKIPYIKNGNMGVYFYLRCKNALCVFGCNTRIHFHSKV